MDEETVSQDPVLIATPTLPRSVLSRNPNPQKKQATNCMKNWVF
jgi:hypothetical protein